MKIGPRYKICKRLGNGVFEKCQTQKFALSEARKSAMQKRGKRPRQLSDYGKQLIEKQRVRFTYGLGERQLVKYIREAERKTGNRAEHLLGKLESRLDNVIYRLGIASTRRGARQMVSHGHIKVNGTKVTIPSYLTKKGDIVAVRDKSKESPLFTKEDVDGITTPSWLRLDTKKLEGTVKTLPSMETSESTIDLTTVMEYYSR